MPSREGPVQMGWAEPRLPSPMHSSRPNGAPRMLVRFYFAEQSLMVLRATLNKAKNDRPEVPSTSDLKTETRHYSVHTRDATYRLHDPKNRAKKALHLSLIMTRQGPSSIITWAVSSIGRAADS